MRPLWELLPQSAQEAWPAEAPDPVDSTEATRLPASLPDLEVVYQVVESFGGNIEVQAEFYFDVEAEPPAYDFRQVGKRLLASPPDVWAPDSDQPQGEYILETYLVPVASLELSKSYDIPANLPTDLSARLAFEDERLSVLAYLREVEADRLIKDLKAKGLDQADEAAIQALAAGSYSYEVLHRRPPELSENMAMEISALPPLIELIDSDELTLVWEGDMSEEERQALDMLPGDPQFKAGLRRLKAAATDSETVPVVRQVVPSGPEQSQLQPDPEQPQKGVGSIVRALSEAPLPSGVKLIFETGQDGREYERMSWIGVMTPEEDAVLQRWASFKAFADAVAELQNRLNQPVSIAVPPPRPLQSELPEVISDKLIIGTTSLKWSAALSSLEFTALSAALAVLRADF